MFTTEWRKIGLLFGIRIPFTHGHEGLECVVVLYPLQLRVIIRPRRVNRWTEALLVHLLLEDNLQRTLWLLGVKPMEVVVRESIAAREWEINFVDDRIPIYVSDERERHHGVCIWMDEESFERAVGRLILEV